MKTSKKISFLLICAMVLNLFCTFSAFAATTGTISGAVTEFTLGNNGTLQNSGVSGFTQYGGSVYSTGDGTAKYVDFVINSPVEAVYKFQVKYGSTGGTSNMLFNIYVNNTTSGNHALSETIPNTGNEDSGSWGSFGTHSSIKLNAGDNTIRIQHSTGNVIKIVGLRFTAVGAENTAELGAGSYTISSGSSVSGGRGSTTMNAGGSFVQKVYAADAGTYKVYANTTTSAASTLNVTAGTSSVDGTIAASAGYQEIGVVTLAQGANDVTIKNTGSASITVNKIKYEPYVEGEGGGDEPVVNDIAVSADGFTWYGTYCVIENMVVTGTGEKTLILMVAGYDAAGTKLQECKFIQMKVSSTKADGVTITVNKNGNDQSPVDLSIFNTTAQKGLNSSKSLSGSSAVNKAFLFDAADYSPICVSSTK